MNITKFLTKKVDTQEAAVALLSEFVASLTSSMLQHYCTICNKHEQSCNCEFCEECDRMEADCECPGREKKPSIIDDGFNEAALFAKRWNIPFDLDLHKSIIGEVLRTPDAIWNSSSAFC